MKLRVPVRISLQSSACRNSVCLGRQVHTIETCTSMQNSALNTSWFRLPRTALCIRPLDAVGREKVEELLEAANWAPTHGRTEPWRFVVLTKQAQLQMLELTLQVIAHINSTDDMQLQWALSTCRTCRGLLKL